MTTPIFGVDAASMQQRVDWATVDSITAFGFEKTIQGTGYTNPYWADAKTQMLARAAATGFVPGAGDCSAFRGPPAEFRALTLPAAAPVAWTPGRMAYNGYAAYLGWHDKGARLPWWAGLSDRERAGWEAAAKAVTP